MNTKRNFHEGEAKIQAQAGVDTEAFERMVSEAFQPELSASEMAFVERRTFSVAASIDEAGRPWASPLLAGAEQLFVVADPTTVRATPQKLPGDPLHTNIAERGELGVLYFDPSLRRRAKSIGTATVDGDTITYRMGRNFGLCSKYIFKRSHEPTSGSSTADRPAPTVANRLAADDRRQLQSADTIFLASHHVVNGADATHRGGPEGFVSIVDEKTIAVPDYMGNGMFNTLGNLQVDSRIGLLSVDFVTGRTVQITGTATLTSPPAGDPMAERTLLIDVAKVATTWPDVGTWTDIEAFDMRPGLINPATPFMPHE